MIHHLHKLNLPID